MVTVSDCYQWVTPRCLVIGTVHWTGQGVGSAALDSEVMPHEFVSFAKYTQQIVSLDDGTMLR